MRRRTESHRLVVSLLMAATIISSRQAAAADVPYSIERRESQRIQATLTFAIEVPKLKATDWVVVVGKPPELPSQSDVSSHLDASAASHVEVGGIGRSVLRARVPVNGGPRETRFETTAQFDATLYSRKLVQRSAPADEAPQLDKLERDAYLRKTPMFDFAATPFTEWLYEHELSRRKNESDVDLGRRAFQAVVQSMNYKYQSEMARNASHVCETGKTDCGGMCVMFVSAMRANKVPSRVLAGCWAKSSVEDAMLQGTRYYQTHVKAEFFASGIGWVPVDPSSAVLHDRSEEKLEYFGNDPGDFLTLHVDPDLKVDSIHFGVKTLPWLQQFNFFVRGKGTMDGMTTKMDWQVTSTKAEPQKQSTLQKRTPGDVERLRALR
ncbi:MAG: transglutaminase family protein [Planctomycetales bacterium]|nr:transglutaminase family protein [Planctomycetales bacterium]